MDIDIQKIKNLATQQKEHLQATRRHLHAHPELSFQEYKTTEFIANKLAEMGLTLVQLTDTGGYVDIQGKNPSVRVIALRADIDALPIFEKNLEEYASKNEGVMHACGHDVHTTCLLGAIYILLQMKDEFEGTIRCIFQPGEERLPGGAKILIEKGVLENPKVEKIIGQHVMPLIDCGRVGFRPGQYMASADEIYITLKGKGGHGAHPHMCIDPVVTAAQMITALQTVVSRKAKPATPSVLSIGKIIGEGSTNVIPNEVKMEGTFRTFDESWRFEAHDLIKKICTNTAEMNGATVDVEVAVGYPSLVNNVELTNDCKAWAVDFLGSDKVDDLDIWPAGEDFAYYSQKIPACFYRLGIRNEQKKPQTMLHTPTFDIDEDALSIGASLMAYLALKELNE